MNCRSRFQIPSFICFWGWSFLWSVHVSAGWILISVVIRWPLFAHSGVHICLCSDMLSMCLCSNRFVKFNDPSRILIIPHFAVFCTYCISKSNNLPVSLSWRAYLLNEDGINIKYYTHRLYTDESNKWQKMLFFPFSSSLNHIFAVKNMVDGCQMPKDIKLKVQR